MAWEGIACPAVGRAEHSKSRTSSSLPREKLLLQKQEPFVCPLEAWAVLLTSSPALLPQQCLLPAGCSSSFPACGHWCCDALE